MDISALPIVMIPAAALLSLTFNNRLIPILTYLKEFYMKEQSNTKEVDLAKNFLYKRARWLRVSILSEYIGIMLFTIAAVQTLISHFFPPFYTIATAFMMGGALFVFLGTFCATIEMVYALHLYEQQIIDS